MYILSVIPITKIPRPAPQTLDYFSSKTVSAGGIVEIPIGRRKVLAIVLSCASVSKKRQYLKKSSFALKSVGKVLCAEEIIPKKYLSLLIWTSNYYYAPLGLIAKSLLPQLFSKPTKKFIEELSSVKPDFNKTVGVRFQQNQNLTFSKNMAVLYWDRHNEQEKIAFYKKQIKQALKKKWLCSFSGSRII